MALFMMFSTIPIATFTANAASSYTIPVNMNLLKQCGVQKDWTNSCSCYALAYCRTLLDGKVHYYYEYNRYGKDETSVDCIWSKGNYSSHNASSISELLRVLYNNINANKPTIVYVKGNYNHYIMIVGYQNVSNVNNLSFSNFLMIDSLGISSRNKTLAIKLTSSRGYSIASSRQYVVPNSGSVATKSYAVTTNNATNVNNYSATISGSLSPNAPATWGFSIGYSSGKWFATRETQNRSTINIKDFVGELKAGTTYYYQMFSRVAGTVKYGSVKSFTTTNVKPNVPNLNISNKDIAIGDTISASWSSVSNVREYTLRLFDEEDKEVQSATVSGTSHAFKGLSSAGKYYATIEAKNNAGSKGQSAKIEITVHHNVTVKFVDYDGKELCEPQVIGYNKNANAPAKPYRRGYTFDKWDNSYSNVKEDITIKATYTINKYKVTFKDEKGNVLKTETVEFEKSATAPDYKPANGYKLTGWDKDFSSVEEDITTTANIDWYNKNYLVHASVTSAVRVIDNNDDSNEGYDIDVSIKNNDEKLTRGRVIVALQTEEGKLLTSTESAAFSIKKSDTKVVNVFVPYDNAAKQVKVYVVSQYSDAVPIAEAAVSEINQDQAFSNWSTEEPPKDAYKTETRTEYRYKTKSTTTSYDTSLSGWTQNGSQWINTGSGNIDYVSSWPSGFNRNHWIYGSYNKSPYYAYENATDKRTVSTSTIGYVYYHWCRGDNAGTVNRRISYNYSSEFKCFHAFKNGNALGYNSKADAFQASNSSVCNSTYWWNSVNPNSIPVRRCNYTNYKKRFNYYKWSDFSDWGTTAKAADDNTIVETRTVYRYLTNDAVKEDTTGKERTISGKLDVADANKQATLYIYKVDSASDYSNEYIGQTTIKEDGSYSFTFKLREEPTVETGDFTVVLGVEGASTGVYLDKIEAPKKTYKVKFYDYAGKILSEQDVVEGKDAQLPDESSLTREGYEFINWTESNRNIREDLDIYPNYKLNQYTVVFVDWTSKYVSMKKFNHGDILVTPDLGIPDEDKTIKWKDVDENTIVTKDMIVVTDIEDKTVEVKIDGFEGKKLGSQNVKYDTAFDLPTLESTKDYIFLGWKKENNEGTVEDLTDTIVTENVRVFPEYVFANTVETPTASVAEGEYNKAQTVELSCATEGATIYYTIDGTDPTTSKTAIEYSEPISLKKSCELRFYACALSMNDSDAVSNLYAINSVGNPTYHVLTIYDNAINSGYNYRGLVKENFVIDINDFKDMHQGYTFDSLYYDSEYTDKYQDNETVIESLTLYAKFNPIPYQVTFKDYDGKVIDTQTVNYSESANAPSMSRDGYVFVGWDTDDYLCVQKDTVAVAKYVPENEYAKVSLNRKVISFIEGTQYVLKATINPANLSDTELEWYSEDTSIASVDSSGVVTGNSVGKTKIVVTVLATGETASCDVNISGNINKSIYLYTNSYLKLDKDGYIRSVPANENTVENLKTQFMNENLKFYSIDDAELKDNDLIGTGSKVKLFDGDSIIDEKTFIMTGDYNGDGLINNKDVVLISKYCVDKADADMVQLRALDVNGDGYVNNRDSAMLSRYLVGKEKI